MNRETYNEIVDIAKQSDSLRNSGETESADAKLKEAFDKAKEVAESMRTDFDHPFQRVAFYTLASSLGLEVGRYEEARKLAIDGIFPGTYPEEDKERLRQIREKAEKGMGWTEPRNPS